MACFSPLRAFQTEGGEIVFVERGRIKRPLVLPCGQCIGCRLERSRQWAMRCMHEASLHDENSFVTLTYSDEHVPDDYSLDYGDFQKFMKRLRKVFGKARFYMCGEYGEQFYRPHFHACLFGVGFPDRVVHSTSGSGHDVFTSRTLERLWPFGFSSIGEVTFESAAYVARYVMKKVTGQAAEDHYMRVVEETGQLVSVVPEFTHMSLKPGIGRGFYDKFRSDMYPRDYVVVNGQKVRPPKYYDRLEREDDQRAADMELLRYMKSFEYDADCAPHRLEAREKVTRARLAFKRRSLE